MRSFRALIFFLSAAACAGQQQSRPTKCAGLREERRVSVTARAVETDSGAAIHFQLVNTSRESFRLYPVMLPWGNAYAIELSAIGTNGDALSVFFPIDDPAGEDPFVLSPGQSLEGEYHLARRIDVEAARAKSDIVVSWCYQFRVIGERAGGRITGTVVVPRRIR